jgi:hypothetical protein
MPRTPSRFTQADARRIIAAAAQAGVPVAVDFLPDGTIRTHVNTAAAMPHPQLVQKPEASEKRKIVL